MPIAQTRSPRSRTARLHYVRNRLRDLRTQKVEVRKEFAQANDDNDREAITVTGARLIELDEDIAKLKELETRALSALAGVSDGIGTTMANNLEAQQMLSEIAASQAPLSNYQSVGDFMTAQEMCELFGRRQAQQWGAVTVPDPAELIGDRIGPSIQSLPLPALSLLDLFPAVPTGERNVSYMQLSGVPSGADVVAIGALKPGADITYEAHSDEVVQVAVWSKLNRADLDDFDSLGASVQTLLAYDVRRKIEALLIAAIRSAPGLGAPDFTGWTDATNVRDKAIVASAEQATFGYPANFAAYNPLDLAALSIKKTSTGEYLSTPAGPREVSTTALARDEILVGDSNVSAKIVIRSGLSVAIGQESDDMVRNVVTILVETRVLPIIITPAALSLTP